MTFDTGSYHSLADLQKVCLQQNIPFASFRLPLHFGITTLVQHTSEPRKLLSLDEVGRKPGFIMAPFTATDKHAPFLLEPDNIFDGNEIETDFIERLKGNKRFISARKAEKEDIKTTLAPDFVNQVNLAIKEMEDGKFHKVVLSKVRVQDLAINFNISDFYLKLCEKYPHAFVYIVQLPEVGCWVGASPEPLLLVEDEVVKTVSLAGTQLASDAKIGPYVWSEKEIEEQGIVTNFVEKTLQTIGIKDYRKAGPENYRAANLIHLKTSFEFSRTELKSGLAGLLKALHPTPSVGGLPKKEAQKFILANEKHDRSYYTGFLGPIEINGKTSAFVNLRCLQLCGKQFVLYSGAGITSQSVAENEWIETDNKMMTMLDVMHSGNSIE